MRAKVLRIDKKLFDNEIVKVVVPAVKGEMCVLPHHMSIITSMGSGKVRLFTPETDRPTVIEVSGGVFSFFGDVATIML